MVVKADRTLFAHMVLIAQSKNLQIQNVLTHPLGPVPWSLPTDQGSLRKTAKAVLAKELQKHVPVAEDMPEPCAVIIDGMGLVHKLKGDNKKFSDIAQSLLATVLNEFPSAKRIDMVFDVYNDESIKNAERESRAPEACTQYKNITHGHTVRQWRIFLANSSNKTGLIHFLVSEWQHQKYRSQLHQKIIVVTSGSACYRYSSVDFQQVSELACTHEEAETRLLFHAEHIAKSGFRSVVIVCDDTDVFVLCLAYSRRLFCQLFSKHGSKIRTEFIDIGSIVIAIRNDVCTALLGLHAMTGCDTVSAFAGRGKLSALKMVQKDESVQKMFSVLGVN